MKSWSIRPIEETDLPQLAALERTVWEPKGIETAPEDILRKWMQSGILLGCFREGELLGYAYAEVIRFSPLPPYSTELQRAMESYKSTETNPEGNALHGVSIAVVKAGAGTPLLEALVEEARRRRLRYFVSLARLEGLGRFVQRYEAALAGYDLPAVAALYALEVVSLVDPRLIGPPLSLVELPPAFPRTKRKDLVLGRFARLGKELWGVAETSFSDPKSLGYSALLVLAL
jgi:hypothetical protein